MAQQINGKRWLQANSVDGSRILFDYGQPLRFKTQSGAVKNVMLAGNGPSAEEIVAYFEYSPYVTGYQDPSPSALQTRTQVENLITAALENADLDGYLKADGSVELTGSLLPTTPVSLGSNIKQFNEIHQQMSQFYNLGTGTNVGMLAAMGDNAMGFQLPMGVEFRFNLGMPGMGGNVSFEGSTLKNIATPQQQNDATNKDYVDQMGMQLQNAINEVTTGLKWKGEFFAITKDADLAAVTAQTELSTLLPFSDDEGTQLQISDFVAGQRIASVHPVTNVAKYYNVVDFAGVLYVTNPLAFSESETFTVRHDLIESPADQEGRSIYTINFEESKNQAFKIAEFNWSLATGINLSPAYSALAVVGGIHNVVAINDTVEVAISKLDGNVKNLETIIYDQQSQISDINDSISDLEDQIAASLVVFDKYSIILSAADITNGYIDLPYEAKVNSVVAFLGRLAIHQTVDYDVSVVGGVSRISWDGLLIGEEAPIENDRMFFTFVRA